MGRLDLNFTDIDHSMPRSVSRDYAASSAWEEDQRKKKQQEQILANQQAEEMRQRQAATDAHSRDALQLEDDGLKLQAHKDDETSRVMANDAAQWASAPEYAGRAFSAAPAEARQHFITAYPRVASQVPQAWNQAQQSVTGDPNIGLPPTPEPAPGETVERDSKGNVSVRKTYVPPATPDIDPSAVGEDALKGLPSGEAALARSLATYQLSPGVLGRIPADKKMRIIQGATAFDPSFDMKEYAPRQALITGFKSGPQSQNIASLNTVIGHLDGLSKASKELGNYSLTPLNYVKNAASNAAGSAAITKFDQNATAVESELAKLFKGTGVATNQEIKEWRKSFNSNMSPAQIDASIEKAVELMASRMEALKNQYEQGLKRPKDRQWLNPKSMAILNNMGVNADELDSFTENGTATALPPVAQGSAEPEPVTPAGPKAGDVMDGYRYKGGNPALQTSWEAVQ